MIKDIGEQLEEKIHRVRSGRAPSTVVSVPVELGCSTLPAHGCVHYPGTLHFWNFYGHFIT